MRGMPFNKLNKKQRQIKDKSQFVKMSASKIIIHKYEAGGIHFKHLQVTAEEDSKECATVYSDWLDGKIPEKKKDPDKSSRLVVKLISGSNPDSFDLDSCAREIQALSGANFFKEYSIPKITVDELFYRNGERDHAKEYFNSEESADTMINQPTGSMRNLSYKKSYTQNNKSSLGSGDYLSPLEHSLEKVKENNARIMENIHMLNRTLDYTKKKEILDIVCPKTMRSYYCNACGKCFVYETGLRRHYFMRHAMSSVQPRWQVVWTCIQCFQVWPHQDQALNHSNECCKSNNGDNVREIKTSSLLQCEFCEKVYTSIPRLLRHSKIHTTKNNYECNACEMAFSSYKTAEAHWISCSWLKMFYSFSLPKLLLCNACDRKFRNYEQLYNHRYKVDHFMTKIHCNPYSTKIPDILVYQCEVCAAWFQSMAPLKAHKHQHNSKHELMQLPEKILNEQNFYIISDENDLGRNQANTTTSSSQEQEQQ